MKYHRAVDAAYVDQKKLYSMPLINMLSYAQERKGSAWVDNLVEKVKANPTIQRTFCLSISVNPYKCPPAPYELTFLAEEVLRKEGVRDNTKVVITAPW